MAFVIPSPMAFCNTTRLKGDFNVSFILLRQLFTNAQVVFQMPCERETTLSTHYGYCTYIYVEC